MPRLSSLSLVLVTTLLFSSSLVLADAATPTVFITSTVTLPCASIPASASATITAIGAAATAAAISALANIETNPVLAADQSLDLRAKAQIAKAIAALQAAKSLTPEQLSLLKLAEQQAAASTISVGGAVSISAPRRPVPRRRQ